MRSEHGDHDAIYDILVPQVGHVRVVPRHAWGVHGVRYLAGRAGPAHVRRATCLHGLICECTSIPVG
eukprot:14237935-Alexandrium_andersonii.AAC.1